VLANAIYEMGCVAHTYPMGGELELTIKLPSRPPTHLAPIVCELRSLGAPVLMVDPVLSSSSIISSFSSKTHSTRLQNPVLPS